MQNLLKTPRHATLPQLTQTFLGTLKSQLLANNFLQNPLEIAQFPCLWTEKTYRAVQPTSNEKHFQVWILWAIFPSLVEVIKRRSRLFGRVVPAVEVHADVPVSIPIASKDEDILHGSY